MVFNTLTVGAAVTPSVIETYFSHYLNRAPLKQKPTAHIGYHEGLRLIRQFLDYSSKHTVEDLQTFTAQWVPAPHWVRINDAEVAPKFLDRAAKLLHTQLGHRGLEKIGGKTWWQWRRPEQPLRAEWIEMKKEYHERKQTGEKCERVILYVHGGAYYFGSVDEHRYQMQRHARKLKARVLAPRYRLAPQFPFPCGLYDCLATYYYLLEHFDPSQILFAGDSAGAGMVLSMLVILRDQRQPLPAGTILLSPWVDLTHSFPSVAGDGIGDYIPPHGFHHKPSMAWPPLPAKEPKNPSASYGQSSDAVELPATIGLTAKQSGKTRLEAGNADSKAQESFTALPLPTFGHALSIVLDGQSVELKEQIQLYTTNELLAHPLVSPAMQPSLGGLPPMLIQVGGSELLRDEQIYLAHKAADPKAFPPNDTIMREFDPQRRIIDKYPPTNVQLQVWDDLCHVAPTLSFTRPAKYMYRSVAQFGAWAFSHAQHKNIDIQSDDAISIISSLSGDYEEDDPKSTADSMRKESKANAVTGDASSFELKVATIGAIGKAGDPLPEFKDHMIRQRVTRYGMIFPLAAPSEMASLALDPASIGVPKAGPVRKWLAARSTNDQRFASERKKILKKREKEISVGYDEIPGENPPPSALVNRRRRGVAPDEKKKGKSWGLAMWSGWGSSHDEHTLQREEKNASEANRKQSMATETTAEPKGAENGHLTVPESSKKQRRNSTASKLSTQFPWSRERERPRSPYTQVRDTGQADSPNGSPAPSAARLALNRGKSDTSSALGSRPISMAADSPIPVEEEREILQRPTIPTTATISPESEKIPGSENTFLSPTSSRPHNGVNAYPFRLRDQNSNPSMVTLDSQAPGGIPTPASGAHSELAGDAPSPVELPSTTENTEQQNQSESNTTESIPQRTRAFDPSHASIILPIQGVKEVTKEPPEQEPPDDVVSPIEQTKDDTPEAPISPVEAPKTTVPFKIRNPVFDPRTSMLGSIGADGMPNAHHDFPLPPLRSTSDLTTTSTAQVTGNTAANVTSKESGKSSEATKAAPFKLRHVVYDPNATLNKCQAAADTLRTLAQKQEEAPSRERSPSPLTPPDLARSSGSSSDKPPSYDSMPLTNVTIPEIVGSKPITREQRGTEIDVPPTPPPKDDKPYFRNFVKSRKANEENRKPEPSVQVSKDSKFNTAAPIIGDLSFEHNTETEKRPQLESFVTASEGRDLKSS